MIFTDTKLEDAVQVMDELRIGFSELMFSSAQGRFHVSFSAGVSELQLNMGANALCEVAEALLYSAKEAGRNCVRGGNTKG